MEKLHDEAKAKGLIFLNEVGLDPGIDIMGTMKVKDDAEAKGYKIVSYESYCGGLPVAEQADNPLGYKFSWNPGAAIKASKNKATYKKGGKVRINRVIVYDYDRQQRQLIHLKQQKKGKISQSL